MKHIDLFSGIGGFALAVDRVFYEQENQHIFVENDPFCQAVLRKHWPEAKIHGDIRAFTNTSSERRVEREPNDNRSAETETGDRPAEANATILTGGFPCQPFSQAGVRQGISDERYLWPEMLRVIREFRPEWVIAENVNGLLSIQDGLVFEQVCADLENEGYEVQPYVIPACAVGAPHRRDRVWIVGYSGSERLERQEKEPELSDTSEPTRRYTRQWERSWQEVAFATCNDGVDDGVAPQFHSVIMEVYGYDEEAKMESAHALSQGGYSRWEELRRLWEQRKTATPSSFLYQFGLCDTLPDLSSEERPKRWVAQEETAQKVRNLWQEFYSLSYEKAQDMQSRLLEQIGEIERNEALVFKKSDTEMSELWARVYLPTSATGSVYEKLWEQTGLAKEETEIMSAAKHRKERLKACGNAIVPQVAEKILEGIKYLHSPRKGGEK